MRKELSSRIEMLGVGEADKAGVAFLAGHDLFTPPSSQYLLDLPFACNMSSPDILTGGCECGRVRYTARGVCGSPCWCYCKQCQRVSGAPFIPFADFKKTAVTWTTKPDVFKSSNIAERMYCQKCGSTIGMEYYFQPESLGIALGTADNDCKFSTAPATHIFLKDKPAWFKVPEDGAKRYDGHNTDGNIIKQMQEYEEKQQSTP